MPEVLIWHYDAAALMFPITTPQAGGRDNVVEDVPSPREQRGLIIIHKLRGVGRSLREIAHVLEELGPQPKRGWVWSPAAIRRILLREAA